MPVDVHVGLLIGLKDASYDQTCRLILRLYVAVCDVSEHLDKEQTNRHVTIMITKACIIWI